MQIRNCRNTVCLKNKSKKMTFCDYEGMCSIVVDIYMDNDNVEMIK